MQLLKGLKETRVYWKLKQETLARAVLRLALEQAVDQSQDRLRSETFIKMFLFLIARKKDIADYNQSVYCVHGKYFTTCFGPSGPSSCNTSNLLRRGTKL
jgi:hypothetical protein